MKEKTMKTTTNEAPILEVLREVVDDATVGKVFGSPIHLDDLTLLPVAKIGGGGGGGTGTGPVPDGQESGGTGGGFGMSAKPLGVFVLKDGTVTWRPAIDVNRVVLGGQFVAVTGLLVLRALIKARAARRGPWAPIRQIAERAQRGTRAVLMPVRRLRHVARLPGRGGCRRQS
jgi:uncharacterized spore protein YtfJ